MRCLNPECPDRLVFGVVGEYGPELSHCPKCGSVLGEVPAGVEQPEVGGEPPLPVAERPDAVYEPMPDEPEVGARDDFAAIPFMAFEYPHEANLVRALLDSSGIDSMVTCDDLGRQNPILGAIHEAFVLVPQPQLEQADALVEACEEGQVDLGGPGLCAVCAACGFGLDKDRIECPRCDPGEARVGARYTEMVRLLRRLRGTFFFSGTIPYLLLPLALFRAFNILTRLRSCEADEVPRGAWAQAMLIALGSILLIIVFAMALFPSLTSAW